MKKVLSFSAPLYPALSDTHRLELGIDLKVIKGKLQLEVKMGGTILTAADGGISGGHKLPPEDSSQYKLRHLAYMQQCVAVAENLKLPLVIYTGTDSMASVAYGLGLMNIQEASIGILGSMYHTEDPLFDGKENEELLQKHLEPGTVKCVVDKTVYIGTQMQKTCLPDKNAFGEPSKKLSEDPKGKVQSTLDFKIPSLLTHSLPAVDVVGITQQTTAEQLRLFLENRLRLEETKTPEGLIVYGPMTHPLLNVCEEFSDRFLGEAIALTVVNTGSEQLQPTVIPLLSQAGETSERAQVKLSCLLHTLESETSLEEGYRNLQRSFSGALASEFDDESYYQPQRIPTEMTGVYVPRQLGITIPLIDSVKCVQDHHEQEQPIIIGCLANNMPGMGSETPNARRSQSTTDKPGLNDSGYVPFEEDSLCTTPLLKWMKKQSMERFQLLAAFQKPERLDDKDFDYGPGLVARQLNLKYI